MAIITDKAYQIMDEIILQQYHNSPNLQAYIKAFLKPFNDLFTEMQKVELGRYIETAEGTQLDVIGLILQQSRNIIVPKDYFGFLGAVGANSFGTLGSAVVGGVFKSIEEDGYNVLPLSDHQYKRVLMARGYVLSSDVVSIEDLYHVAEIFIGRANIISITETDPNLITLNVNQASTNDTDITLLEITKSTYIPVGKRFEIVAI